jgi:hypothetical protein
LGIRYEGKKIVGSALVHENTVIHMAFFQITENGKGRPHVSRLPEKGVPDKSVNIEVKGWK